MRQVAFPDFYVKLDPLGGEKIAMRKIGLGLLCTALGSVASGQAPAGPDTDAVLFGARETATQMSLAPGGGRVAFIGPQPSGGTVAYTADFATGETKPFLSSIRSGEHLRWCRFVTDQRLICNYTTTLMMNGQLVPFTRLIAVNSDGSGQTELGQRASDYDRYLRQADGAIIDWLPGEGGSVLMAKSFVPEVGKTGSIIVRSQEGLGVARIDTRTLQARNVEPPKMGVSDYWTDGRGAVRIMSTDEQKGEQLTGRAKYSYRTAGSREWRTLNDYADWDSFVPLAVDATTDSLYVLKPLNGRKALYRVKLAAPTATELVASNPRVDIDQVVRSASGERVIGYNWAEDRRQAVYFDPEYRTLHKSLTRALPKLPMIDFLGASADGSKVLMFAAADNDPGRYFLFNKLTKQLAEIVPSRPKLDGHALASVKAVSIPLGNGLSMPAYLTLPLGKDGKLLPAVVLPHGGPSARDEWGFDWLAQYLVARGYAVLQPNYRGSAGFGDQWLMQNGFRSWQTSIGDIATGARWLASQGIADPNRMAVVGWSYGGYAALQAAATQPDLFKAVAAISPVTDLAMLKEDARDYTNAKVIADMIGAGPHVRDGSPLQRVGSIKVPVLLAHGDMDLNVAVRHSAKMDGALRAAGTKVQFMRYKSLDHQLDDSVARAELLTAMGRLLEQSIGR